MRAFQYSRASDLAEAGRLAKGGAARFIAGGTNLLDLMKLEVETPEALVDITRLPLKSIEETSDGGLRIGALVAECGSRGRSAHPARLSGSVAGAARRRLRAAAQQGLDRRKSPAAHAVLLFL